MTEDIFEKGTRENVRFEHKGLIAIEDLWHVPFESLDSIYTKLMASAKRSNEEGLLKTRKAEDKLTDLKIAIVKRVFEVRQEEEEKRKLAVKNRQKKEFLKGILEQKQNEQILSKSAEEIAAMIDSIGEVEE